MSLTYKGQIIANVGGSGGGSSEEVYSTEETRIGTWIDGKPLYRRAIKTTVPYSSVAMSGYTITDSSGNPINISDDAIDTVVSLSGMAKYSSDWASISSAASSDYRLFQLEVSYRSLKISSKSMNSAVPVVIIVEFTKVKDTGGAA